MIEFVVFFARKKSKVRGEETIRVIDCTTL